MRASRRQQNIHKSGQAKHDLDGARLVGQVHRLKALLQAGGIKAEPAA